MDVSADFAAGPGQPPGGSPPDQGPRSEGERRLFSALSREICRPLISLCAGFDLLLAGSEGDIAPEQRRQVQSLRGHCDDLIRLTRSFLDYAGPTRPSRDPEWATFRLGSLIDEADRQFSGPAAGRGLRWTCRVVGDDGPVATDLSLFQRIVESLVTNALAHTTDEGSISITARIEGDHWSLVVADDGAGIPPEVLGRAFEPLVRLHGVAPAEGSAGGAGHGMGLAVCREVIERLGGSISLGSELGRGTSATVRFPREAPGPGPCSGGPG